MQDFWRHLVKSVNEGHTIAVPQLSSESQTVTLDIFRRSCLPWNIPSDALIASFIAGGIFPYSSQEGRAQDHLKKGVVFGSRRRASCLYRTSCGGRDGGCGWGGPVRTLCLTHLLIPKGKLSSGGFHSRKTGVKELWMGARTPGKQRGG